MIYHDKVETIERVQTGTDPYGNPTFEDVRTPHRAEVQPLSSSENVEAGQQVTTRYKAYLPPHAALDPTGAIYWDGKQYEVEGDVEPHKANGRLHHREVVIKRVTG